MPYCRKCGAQLDEDARFCRKCGTPVEGAPVSPSVRSRHMRSHRVFPATILIGILLVAFLVVVFVVLPFGSVDFSQTNVVSEVSGVNTVKLNFDADVADVNIIPTDLPNQLVKLEVNATGSSGFFGSTSHPVDVTFTNETSGNTLTVTSSVSRTQVWPFSFNLKVTCNVYVERTAILIVTAKTSVGSITLSPVFRVAPLVFQNLTLQSTTGSVNVNLTGAVDLAGDVSVSTTTGSIQFTWGGVAVSHSLGVTLASTTGSISANVSQSGAIGGNVSINAATTTGSVNWGMDISGNVGAQFTSTTTTGSISVDVQNFSGDKSPIASSNYPAVTNFIVNSQSTTGSVHIAASYHHSSQNSEPDQVRADVVSFLPVNHPELAQLVQGLGWKGGGVNIVPNPIYTVFVDYREVGTGIPYRIIWQSLWQTAS
jgi:hypothetical protein